MNEHAANQAVSHPDIYTREEIESGLGCFTNERTAIYERPDGRFETHDLSAKPSSSLVLVGYAHPRTGQPARVVWV